MQCRLEPVFDIIMAKTTKKFILGKKIAMTRIFQEDGTVIPVTLVEAGPIVVTQVKTTEKDGYEAIQVGYGSKKHNTKPLVGHLKDHPKLAKLKEFKAESAEGMTRGALFDVSIFTEGDIVKVSGLSKGKGFQGAVKRHGFHGMPASHGAHHVLRHVGSIGQRFPQHTLKGMRMAGHMGNVRISTRGLTIVKIDKEHNILAIKGAVPGRRGSLLEIISI